MGKGLTTCAFILSLVPATAVSQILQSLPTNAPNERSEPASKGSGGYYVEFRVAQIGTYGHSYAVYGSHKGRPNYADLHPVGGYAVMALGHVIPVPANTEWDSEVLNLPIAAKYRRTLNSQQYQKLVAKVRSLRAKAGYWNAVTNNCNHFIGELAQAVGLRVPATFQVSYTFVPALRVLNENQAEQTGDRTRKPAPADAGSSF